MSKTSIWKSLKTIRKILFLGFLLVLWELVARIGNLPSLLFPTFSSILASFGAQIISGELVGRTLFSLYLIGIGLGIALVTALIITALTVCLPFFSEWIQVLIAIIHPLPAIAILPVTILWLGTGSQSIIAVIMISAVWPVIANLSIGLRLKNVSF